MNITLGSLLSEDYRTLQELNLLPEDEGEDDDNDQLVMSGGLGQGDSNAGEVAEQHSPTITRTQRSGRSEGMTWFEEMLDGSRLGRTQKTRRGVGVSDGGSTRVEWEISEYFEDGSGGPQTPTGSKRKIDEMGKDDDDVSMQQ